MPTHALIRRQSSHPAADGTLLSISPEDAGWGYVSFTVWRLRSGQVIKDDTASEEIVLVLLSGRATIESSAQTWRDVGGRDSVFAGKPHAVYLPPCMPFTVSAFADCEIARAGAPATEGAPARLITPDEIAEEARGEGNARRYVRRVLLADRPAERLLVSETVAPSGNWSSYPPHKHDTDDPPRESPLEETYYHRIDPPQGFGFQRIYTANRTLDEVLLIEDGTLVLVPRGYHPTVVAPGYTQYYLNVMAGPTREWRISEDPDHAWA